MSNTDRGVLFLHEWYEAMECLNPKAYKEMMHAIWRYQLCGEEPPEFKGKSAIIAAMIFPYISRRISSARAAKIGIQTRVKQCDAKAKLAELMAKYPPQN